MMLMVGGPGDGKLLELDDRAVTVTVPIPGAGIGISGFTYVRRRVAGRYILTSERYSDDNVLRLMARHATQRAIVLH